jgi:RND superfamily putative drug exporter
MHRQVAGALTSRTTKWIAVVFWLALVAFASPLASKLSTAEDNNQSAWVPNSAESTQAMAQLERFRDSDQAPAVVVYERPSGITAEDTAVATADAKAFGELAHVGDVQGPFQSDDGQALSVLVPITMGEGGWDTLGVVVTEMRNGLDGRDTGLSVHVTGPGGVSADFAEVFDTLDGRLLLVAGSVVILLLLLTYRSPVLWLLPLISVVIALLSAQAVIYLLGKNDIITVNAQGTGILTVLVFGAGTDYALLLVARYREELRRHEDRHEAMAVALHRCGPAIFASATTVVVGMMCLVFADLNSTSGMGPVLAIGITVGMLSMLTLLPALLVIVGRWAFWPLVPAYGSVDHTRDGIWARLGAWISRRPRVVWVVTTLVLGTLALGMTSLKAEGLSYAESFTGKPESIVGEEILAKHFDVGVAQPAYVISSADSAGGVTAALEDTPGIVNIAQPQEKDGLALIDVTLAAAPDSIAAQDTVAAIRDAVHAVPGADAKVGGDTAVLLDTLHAAKSDNQLIIPIVLVVVFFILAVLLRAILAPLLLIATVVLSFGAALGVSALAFEHVFGFAGADPSLPLFVFVFLVALGIDYNIFLMTRVREEALKFGTRRGSLIGLASTGGVITSAGLVLAGTFAALGTMPMVFLAEIGFAVAFGVLLDTIIVRAILVTALNLDIGGPIWWPSGLRKKPDIEASELPEEEQVLVG